MGVLTDFVVADRGDAQRVCDSPCPSQDFSGMDAKGIDIVKLGTLYAVLTGSNYDPTFGGGDPLATGGDDGPWVTEVPTNLVLRLAKLDDKELGVAAAKWANTEEFSPRYGNWPNEAVHQVLQELAKVCSQAVMQRQSVLMWMSL